MDLTGYFIHAPLSALFTLLLTLSMALVFDVSGKAIFRQDEPWARAAYFFSGLLVTAWAILLLSMAGIISSILLKSIAIGFIIVATILLLKGRARPFLKGAISAWSIPAGSSWFSKLAMYAVYGVLICCLITVLAPPTDADSLNYHLGIPVEILRNGSIWYNRDFLQYRLVGFGEMLNMLGVATGCVQLGAALQLVAFLWLVYVCAEIVPAKLKPILMMLMLGIPVLLFLVPNQKHQLTGIACTSLCFYIVAFHQRQITGKFLILFALCLAFAAGIKYSFIISVAVLLLFMLLKSDNPRSSIAGMFGIAVICILILTPLLAFKLMHFGDILSPILERHKNQPDTVIIKFADHIKNYTDSGFRFPLDLFFPSSVGNVSSVLAWSALMIIAFLPLKQYRKEVVAISIFIALTILLGQRTSRFFLEPYFWLLPLFIIKASELRWGRWFLRIGQLQFFLLIPFFIYAAYILSPGIFSNAGRETVLHKYAHEYDEAQWINTVIPGNAVVATFTPSRAFINKRTFPLEHLSLVFEGDSASIQRIDKMFTDYNVEYLAVDTEDSIKLRPDYRAEIAAGPKTFEKASRNPVNTRNYQLVVYRVNLE